MIGIDARMWSHVDESDKNGQYNVGVGVGIVSRPRDSGVPPLRQALCAKTKSILKSINESITELA